MFYQLVRARFRRSPLPTAPTLSLAAFILGAVLFLRSPLALPVWLPFAFAPLCFALAGPRRALCIGLLLGVAWSNINGQRLLERWLAPDCERVPVTLQGHVASLPEVREARGDRRYQRFLLDVSDVAPARCAGPRRVRLSYYGDEPIKPGQQGQFSALLRVPWGLANPGSDGMESWYAANRIHAVGSVRRLAIDSSSVPLRYRHHRARAALTRAMDELPGPARARGLLVALTVGVRHRLATDDWTLLRELGILHLAVISGLHVSLAGAGGAFLGKSIARGAALAGGGALWRQLPGLLTLLFATLYAALAGFSLPTVRALLMLAAVVLALSMKRHPTSPRTLLLAAFALVCLQPLATVSSGFWLSVSAVGALLWFTGWQPPGNRVAAALRVHAYLCAAMLPLTGWWFGAGSLVAPLANAIAVPIVGLFVIPATLLACLANSVSAALAQWIWQWPLGLLGLLLQWADGLSASTAMIAYRPLGGGLYALANALLAAVLLALPLPLFLRFAAAALLLPLLLRLPPAPVSGPELAVLDVGQGTAVVVTHGKHTLVYDTGGGRPGGYTAADAAVIPFLHHRNIRHIDTLIVSHADNDHSAGTQALLDAFPVQRLLLGQELPGVARGSPCRAGKAWSWPGDIRFQLFTGVVAGQGTADSNDASCVLGVDLAGYRFLLPGDISAARERELIRYWRQDLRADWLLAAHHGSGSSTAAAWLRAVDPIGAVLNYGRANHFRHPHPAVLERLAQRAIEIRATAREGAILFRVSGDGTLRISTSRDGHTAFWRPPG